MLIDAKKGSTPEADAILERLKDAPRRKCSSQQDRPHSVAKISWLAQDVNAKCAFAETFMVSAAERRRRPVREAASGGP